MDRLAKNALRWAWRQLPTLVQQSFDVGYAPTWDFIIDRTPQPTSGPYEGTMFRYTIQVGPLVLRRYQYTTDEEYQAAMRICAEQANSDLAEIEEVLRRAGWKIEDFEGFNDGE